MRFFPDSLLGISRPPQEIALTIVDANTGKLGQFRFFFDSFSNNFTADFFGKSDKGFHQSRLDLVFMNISDQGHVYLDIIGADFSDRLERGKA